MTSCLHTSLKVLIEPPGSRHHARELCEQCGLFMRWLPKPETVERHRRELAILDQLRANAMKLSDWEREFVRSLVLQHPHLSPRQREKLGQIADRVLVL